jgi:hypothetical protein
MRRSARRCFMTGSLISGSLTVWNNITESAEDRIFFGIVRAAATLAGIAIGGSDMELVDRLFTQVAELTPSADAIVERLLGELVEHIQKSAEAMRVEMGETAQMEQNFASLSREKSAV